jgi:hypothetical protein
VPIDLRSLAKFPKILKLNIIGVFAKVIPLSKLDQAKNDAGSILETFSKYFLAICFWHCVPILSNFLPIYNTTFFYIVFMIFLAEHRLMNKVYLIGYIQKVSLFLNFYLYFNE